MANGFFGGFNRATANLGEALARRNMIEFQDAQRRAGLKAEADRLIPLLKRQLAGKSEDEIAAYFLENYEMLKGLPIDVDKFIAETRLKGLQKIEKEKVEAAGKVSPKGDKRTAALTGVLDRGARTIADVVAGVQGAARSQGGIFGSSPRDVLRNRAQQLPVQDILAGPSVGDMPTPEPMPWTVRPGPIVLSPALQRRIRESQSF